MKNLKKLLREYKGEEKMRNSSRLPRKLKKLIKKRDFEKWMNFLAEKKVRKAREEHIDKLFMKDYENAYKVFHKIMRQGK